MNVCVIIELKKNKIIDSLLNFINFNNGITYGFHIYMKRTHTPIDTLTALFFSGARD